MGQGLVPTVKTCNKCNIEFPATLEYFRKDSRNKSKMGAVCRKCKGIVDLAWKKKNPEKVKHSIRKWNLNKLGFTPELFDKMLEAQGNVCALCGSDDPQASNWNSDHDHKTGKARGLLCWPCNIAVGYLEKYDDAWINKAQKYIDNGGFFTDNSQEIVTQS
jgi:hypothetical protein